MEIITGIIKKKNQRHIKMCQGKPPEISLSFFLALCRDSHYCLHDILS